jgi:hypothetical protein
MAAEYLLPEDFELLRQEKVNGRDCSIVLSRAGHYTMCIGVADGRLYYRTWSILPQPLTDQDLAATFSKVAGPRIKTNRDWNRWRTTLEPAKRQQADRDLAIAEFDFTRVRNAESLDDYREVAPGCWLPFRRMTDIYDTHGPQPLVRLHIEDVVTDATVNQRLPDALFHVELREGVPVTTDWRYDPPIHYTYRKNQTEAERIALRNAEREKRNGQMPRAIPRRN